MIEEEVCLSITRFLLILDKYFYILSKRINEYNKFQEIKDFNKSKFNFNNENFYKDFDFDLFNCNITQNSENFELLLGKNYIPNTDKEVRKIKSTLVSFFDYCRDEYAFFSTFSDLFSNFKNKITLKIEKYKECLVDNLLLLRVDNKREFSEFLTHHFNFDIITQDSVLIFFKFLWLGLKSKALKIKSNIDNDFFEICNEIYENMTYYFQGYLVKQQSNFELHDSIFNNQNVTLFKLLSKKEKSVIYNNINECDEKENTPLILALKLKNQDCIEILCDNDVDILLKPGENSLSPLEFAVLMGEKNFLIILLSGFIKQKSNYWQRNLKQLHYKIKNTPNYFISVNLSFTSKIINFLKAFTPHDKFKIYKQDGNLRIDMNISKSYFQQFKGSISIILFEKGNQINVYLINHDKKICMDFFNFIIDSYNIYNESEKILKDGFLKKNISVETFIKENEKSIFKGNLSILTTKLSSLHEKEISRIYSIYNKYYNSYNEFITNNRIKNKSTKNLKNLSNEIDMTFNYDYEFEEKKRKCIFDLNIESLLKQIKKSSIYTTNTESKNFEMNYTINNDFPIKISHLCPVIFILSMLSNEFSTIMNMINKNSFPFNVVPQKISFPVGMSFSAILEVENYSNNRLLDKVFEINMDELDDDIFIKEEEIIENSNLLLEKKHSFGYSSNLTKKKILNINIEKITSNLLLNQEVNYEESFTISKEEIDSIKKNCFFNSKELLNECILKQLLKGKLLILEIKVQNQYYDKYQRYQNFQLNYFSQFPKTISISYDKMLPSEKSNNFTNKNSIKMPKTPKKSFSEK